MRYIFIILILVAMNACGNPEHTRQAAQKGATASAMDTLRESLQNIIRGQKATIGVAVMSMEAGADSLSINGDDRFALMSVAKFPQALLLLHLADEGRYDIRKPLPFGPADLKQRTGSSLLKDHPQPSFSLSLPEALRYSIGQSDNITSNKIFELEGGPKAVEAYVHSVGVAGIGIATDYAHMGADSFRQNWGTPRAILLLLRKFHQRELLSDSSQNLLWTAMVEATSGKDRLLAGLPPGTVIGHKTGTSSTDEQTGITPAYNDVGIVRLPDGRHYGIAVFVADSRESAGANAAAIAAISKAVWRHFNKGQ